MCGIAGVIKWGEKPINEETIGVLLVGNEHRGNDAAGLAVQQRDGSINVLKNDTPGWQLVASKQYEEFIQEHLRPNSRSVLIHARGASRGNPRDNNNNHPITAGNCAVIHNGVLRNSDQMFDKFKLERKAEPDTDIARAIFDKWGFTEEAVDNLSEATGSGAIASVHPSYPDKLMLIRSGNPLTLASNDDFFYFSSEKTTLHTACRPFIERRGMWFQSQKTNVDFTNMPNNTAYLLGPKGLEKHLECRICEGDYVEPWRKTYEEYSTRQQKWNHLAGRATFNGEKIKKDKKAAWCFKCQKAWIIPLDAQCCNYTCDSAKGGCGQILWPMPENPPDGKLTGIRVN